MMKKESSKNKIKTMVGKEKSMSLIPNQTDAKNDFMRREKGKNSENLLQNFCRERY